MPRWDFYCDHCKTTVELAFPSHRDSEHARCAECGGPLTRLISTSSFVVKGYNAQNGYSHGS